MRGGVIASASTYQEENLMSSQARSRLACLARIMTGAPVDITSPLAVCLSYTDHNQSARRHHKPARGVLVVYGLQADRL